MISIEKQWLSSVGGIAVERLTRAPNGRAIARSGRRISNMQEENGVLHTTEGHFGPSLDVFTRTGTPTFLLGRNQLAAAGSNQPAPGSRIRVAQLMPIGEMCLTLQNDSGGTETNSEALVQIELVAFSKFTLWAPDDAVMAVLGDLFRQLSDVCHIPLQRAGDGSRSVARWDGKAGWFGHGEVPENDHTDPRNFNWPRLFNLAAPQRKSVWQLRSGGKVLRQLDVGDVGGVSAYDRLLHWSHTTGEPTCRAAEKANGSFSIRRIEVAS